MTLLKTALLIVSLYLSLSSSAQEQDSVVTTFTIDYEADTIYGTNEFTVRYQNGLEVYSLNVQCNGKSFFDSTMVTTTYDNSGKKIKSVSRSVIQEICEIIPPVTTNYFTFSFEEFESEKSVQAEPTYFYCPKVSTTTTYYFDEFHTKEFFYISNADTIHNQDTVYYYPNRLPKTELQYRNGKLLTQIEYSYQYDEQGREIEITTIDNKPYYKVKTIFVVGYVYYDNEKINSYSYTYKNNSTVKWREFKRIFNDKYQQTGYLLYEDDKLESFGKIKYSKDGHQSELSVYKGDSTLLSHTQGWWKSGKNKTEYWSVREKQVSEELNGYHYSRIDTLKTKNTIEVRSYNSSHNKKVKKRKSPSLSDCKLTQLVIYDHKKRLLSNSNYDYYTGKLSSVTLITYSK